MINIGGGVVTIGADLKQLKSALKDGERALKGFGFAGNAAQRAFNVAMGGVAKGGQAAAKGIEKGIGQALKGFERGIKGFKGAGLLKGMDQITKGLEKGFATASKAVDRGMDQLATGFGRGYKNLLKGRYSKGFSQIFKAANKGFGSASGGIGHGIRQARTGVSKGYQSIRRALPQLDFTEIAKGFNKGISTATAGIEKGINKVLKGISQGISKNAPAILKGLDRGFANAFSAIAKVADVGMHRVHAVVAIAVSAAGSAIMGLSRVAATAFATIGRAAANAFGGIASAAKSAMTSTFAQIISAHAAMRIFTSSVDGLRSLASNAINFESRMAQVRKTTGLAGQGLTAFRGKIESLAQSMSGVKLEELFDISVMGGRLGIASDKLGGFTRDIAMIAVALDDIPAEEAASSIGRILHVFQLGTEQAIRFASALNKLDDSSTATGRDILDLTRRMSGISSVIGLTPQKVLALSTALKDAGVSNEVGGTAMSKLLTKMATEGEKFAVVAGVSGKAFKKMFSRDPMVALQAFLGGLNKLDSEAKLDVLGMLGLKSDRAAGAILQLATVTGKLSSYTHTANSEWRTLGSILRENEIQGQTVAAQLTRMWNAVEILSVKIGESLLPLATSLANSFLELAKDSGRFWDSIKGSVGEGLAPIVKWAERLSVLFQEWPSFLELVSIELEEKMLNGVTFIENLFGQLAAFLGDLFGQVGKTISFHITNAIVDGIGGAMDKVAPGAGAVGDAIKAYFVGVDEVYGKTPMERDADRGQAPKVTPKTQMFNKKGLMAGMVDLEDRKKGPRDKIDSAVKEKTAARKAEEKANKPTPEPAPPAKRTALQRLNDANLAMHGPGAMPMFHGTEAQAAKILASREQKTAFAKKHKAGTTNAVEKEVLGAQFDKIHDALGGAIAAGLISEDDAVSGLFKSKKEKPKRRRNGGLYGMGFGDLDVDEDGNPRGKPKTKSEFHGLEDFAKMTQTGALNQEEYQRKMLANSDKQTKALDKIQTAVAVRDSGATAGD